MCVADQFPDSCRVNAQEESMLTIASDDSGKLILISYQYLYAYVLADKEVDRVNERHRVNKWEESKTIDSDGNGKII